LGNAHRPGLVMHSGDPFRMASGFPDAASYNADFFNQMSIDRIAGELSTAPGHIGETTAGIEAFQAGVENRVLPYDRERVLLMEAADFSDAASKQKFFETRADIIASDQLMRANVGDPVKVAQLELTPEYRQFRDSILRVISDPTILRPGSKTPTDYIEVEKLIEKFPVGKAGASFDQAQAEARRLQSDILYKMQAADPAGIERLRAKDQKIDDFFKNERGEVNTKVALTAGMIAAGAIYLQTLYDAQTVDTGESWNYGDSALNSLRNRAIGRCAGVLEAPRPILRTCRLPDRGPNSALGDPKPRRAGRHKQTQNVTDGQIAQRSARPL
jgi:O6-methylguanine-DNA--protein-cysteine methyltransferase